MTVKHTVAVGVIFNEQNQVLIAKRKAGAHLAGYWEFPGGKVEKGETVTQALSRELNEELGIIINDPQPFTVIHHTYPEREVILDVWQVKEFTGTPEGKEGQPIQWVQRHSLSDFSFPPANQAILKKLEE